MSPGRATTVPRQCRAAGLFGQEEKGIAANIHRSGKRDQRGDLFCWHGELAANQRDPYQDGDGGDTARDQRPEYGVLVDLRDQDEKAAKSQPGEDGEFKSCRAARRALRTRYKPDSGKRQDETAPGAAYPGVPCVNAPTTTGILAASTPRYRRSDPHLPDCHRPVQRRTGRSARSARRSLPRRHLAARAIAPHWQVPVPAIRIKPVASATTTRRSRHGCAPRCQPAAKISRFPMSPPRSGQNTTDAVSDPVAI